MVATAGAELSHYRLIEKIGEGGMGVVWEARDMVLDRTVAIKILPEAFARDAGRLARFEREARVLATLSHPGIAAIHGLEQHDGTHFLVLELVPGKSLDRMLDTGPLPIEETLDLGQQIAAALEAAHGAGVVHRDLKPANIRVTPDGQAKVLDFGLAKAHTPAEVSAESEPTRTPTITSDGTCEGVVLGTPGYLSPEQARGRLMDRRTDVWAFGCVVYEMLTARPAFPGETHSDKLAAVLTGEPDWSCLPETTPRAARRLLERCLVKNARHRLHDAADARIELELAAVQIGTPKPARDESVEPRAVRPRWRTWWAALAAIVGLTLGWSAATWLRPGAASDASVRRFVVPCPDKSSRSPIAISPDGRHLVYSAEIDGGTRLLLRPLDGFEATPLAGTEGGTNPFFSPDGRWLAFFTGRELKKIPLAGGTPRALCSAGGATAGTWGRDDTIVFSSGRGESTAEPVLARVPAAGGPLEVLTTLDPEREERRHVAPHILPDGKTVLFAIEVPSGFRIAALSLDSGERRDVLEGMSPRFTPTGDLVFYEVGAARLAVVAFDPITLRVTGLPVTLVEGVGMTGDALGAYALSANGTLVYSPLGGSRERDTVVHWIDRKGRVTPAVQRPGSWMQPKISPDGSVLLMRESGAPNCYLWTHDLRRRTLSRLTFHGDSHDGIWNHDGLRVTFGSQVETTHLLHWLPADGSTPPERLIPADNPTPNPQFPTSWSRDGRRLLFTERRRQTRHDVLVLEIGDPPQVRPFLESEFDEELAAWSPDGRWIAYQSNESGRPEIYVRAYPGPGGKIQISTDGGTGPLWSGDGTELFYVEGGERMMHVTLTGEAEFRASTPQLLFTGDLEVRRAGNYDLAPDGSRFAFIQWAAADRPNEEVRVVWNWSEEWKGRLREE